MNQFVRTNTQRTSEKGLYEKFLKRSIDFVGALILILALSPLLVVVALLVRLCLGSPVFFKQARPGLNEKIFTLYKFRTMTDEKDEFGQLLSDSKRITRFGRFLRSTSIDELPELFNILKGDMSFVGPRPLLAKYLPFYSELERKRSAVRPGITGLAQISGRNALNWTERFRKDIEYVDNICFFMDVKIILKTILLVAKRKDVLVGTEHVLRDLDEERKGAK